MEQQSFWHKKTVHFLGVAVMVASLVAIAAYAHYTLKLAAGVYTGETTISVSGEGEVVATPDIGSFTFGVTGDGETADEAQRSTNEVVDTILSFLSDNGVTEEDIKTDYYNLNPQYRYEERVCISGSYCPPGERFIDGYQVYQSVTVKVRDLDQAGSLIGGVGEAGATNISQLQFTIDDPSVLQADARSKAIKDAEEKAEALAKDLGMKLGRMVSFYEEGDGHDHGAMYSAVGGERAIEDGMNEASLPTGENTFTSVVSLSYELH